MEQYINLGLTAILIAIYLYNTNSQNVKIKAQSDIINDLKDHLKFFDIQKIKEYVDLREEQKDKLVDLFQKSLQHEFEQKLQQSANKPPRVKNISPESGESAEKIKELSTFVLKKIFLLPDGDQERILNDNFQKANETVREELEALKNSVGSKTSFGNYEELRNKAIELDITEID